MSKLLTQQDVADRLGVSVRTVRRLKIKRVMLGRLVRYRAEDVDRYIARQAGERRDAA